MQMAITLEFSKSEGGIPWGFRLVGGLDFDQPIVVVKVHENSIAEAAGLEVGDIVVRINDSPTAGLTHNEVHDLLLSAGLEFELGIRRGEITSNIISDDDYNIEETNTIKRAIEEEVINEAINKINNMLNSVDNTAEQIENGITENLSGQEEIISTVTLQTTSEVKKGKKWSTFLVKPDKPVPKPKKPVVEEETPKGEPYRVVIKKRTRRPSLDKKVQFDQNVTEVEMQFEDEDTEERAKIDRGLIESVEVQLRVQETEEIIIEEEETSSNDEIYTNDEERRDEEFEGREKRDSVEMERDRLSSMQVNEKVEIAPSLEEQLLAVQKQLQALSQLPSAIQLTLDAVSKQLADIVGTRESAERNGDQTSSSKEEGEEPQTEEEYLEDSSASEKAEAEVLHENSDADSIVADELEEDATKEEEAEENREKEDECENVEDKDERETDPYAGLTEEEKQAQIKKEKLETKKQKTMEERTLKPIQRPIILPGGRKWSMPEDAIPSFRKPKMSDEKIIETIENNLEVIIGKRKGCGMPFSVNLFRESNCWMVPSRVIATKHINFLKYQPPAKNLDYLQRSEVYRLVHDMEPPVRGIISRAEKVPAVQDYYEATQGEP